MLDRLPVGVVVVDRHGYVVKYNRFEEGLARRRRQDVVGRSFFEDVAVCTNVAAIRGVFDRHIATNSLAADIDFEFALPFLPRPREVRLRLQSFAVVVRGVVEQLASVIQNLLSNALKYAASQVTIRLAAQDGEVVLDVADDGPGIAEEHLERIFEERFQAPGSRPGQGLGLYSVKRAVTAHDGEIEVESRLGEGTTFRVVLPSPAEI